MNKHELIGLARLEEAFREHDKLYLEKYPPLENEEINFSKKQIRSKKKRLGKRAMIAVLVALLLFTGMISVSAVRDFVVDFAVNIYERFAELVFDKDDIAGAPSEIEVVYIPNVLPFGYEKLEEHISVNEVKQIWRDENDGMIILTQLPMDTKSTLDTEDSVWETLYVSDIKVLIVEKYDKRSFFWNHFGYAFSLTVSNDVSQEDCIEMIASVCQTEAG